MRKLKLFSLLAAITCATTMWASANANDYTLPGAFSVSADKQIYFSQGNLQATTANNGTTWTWAFAANQYDVIGAATANTAINGNGTVSTNGTVDLFSWSTAATKYGIHNSAEADGYNGDFVDWGRNLELISSLGSGWRTLSKDELAYLFTMRENATDKFSQATVNGVHGLVILPDMWNLPDGCTFVAGNNNTYSANEYDATKWSKMETAGAVFFPANGYRVGADVDLVGEYGHYWSATPCDQNSTSEYAIYMAFMMDFRSGAFDAYSPDYRAFGYAVRLVRENTPAPAAVDITPNVDPENPTVYYSTFYDSANKYALPENVEAYIVTTVSGDAMQLQKVADAGQTIPAGAGVILKASVTPFTLTPSDAEAVSVAGNRLDGADGSISTPSNCYVLSCENNLVGFYHYTASMLNPHKAYIIYSGSNQAPRRLRFVFDQATGVENVQGNVQSTKVFRDGQLVIIRNGVEYNAAGQMVK